MIKFKPSGLSENVPTRKKVATVADERANIESPDSLFSKRPETSKIASSGLSENVPTRKAVTFVNEEREKINKEEVEAILSAQNSRGTFSTIEKQNPEGIIEEDLINEEDPMMARATVFNPPSRDQALNNKDQNVIHSIQTTMGKNDETDDIIHQLLEKMGSGEKKKYGYYDKTNGSIIIIQGGGFDTSGVEIKLDNIIDFTDFTNGYTKEAAHKTFSAKVHRHSLTEIDELPEILEGILKGSIAAVEVEGESLAFYNVNNEELDRVDLPFGSIFDRIGALEDHLFYTPPAVNISLVGGSSTTLKRKGETLTSPVLNISYSFGYEENCDVKFTEYHGSSILFEEAFKANANDSVKSKQYTRDSTTTDRRYNVYIRDSKNTVSKDINVKFVYQMYSNKLTSSQVPTETIIKAGTEYVREKGNISVTFNLNDEKSCVAYPKSYGNLNTISDQNGFNITGSFEKTEISMVMGDDTSVPYYVYTSKNTATASNFRIDFKF